MASYTSRQTKHRHPHLGRGVNNHHYRCGTKSQVRHSDEKHGLFSHQLNEESNENNVFCTNSAEAGLSTRHNTTLSWGRIKTELHSHPTNKNVPPGNKIETAQPFRIPAFVGIGVTSILSTPYLQSEDDNCITTFVGTKRGKLMQVTFDPSDLNETAVIHIDDANGKALKPYPIFSMMGLPTPSNSNTNDNYYLFAGGGDRFMTVWETRNDKIWYVKTQLGPHTGWVKDMATINYDSTREPTIFSIGCNCIEVWKTTDKGDYQHFQKLQIESSVEMGCTLSSDLLCLSTYSSNIMRSNEDTTNSTYLMAGGVDGRIHCWEFQGETIADSVVVSAHNDRVNDIIICRNLNVLVSVGNDGFVHCREINEDSFESWATTSLCINDELKASDEKSELSLFKITSSCIVEDDSRRAIVAIGTACGKVLLVEITRSDGSDLVVSLIKDKIIDFESSCVIHALKCFRKGGRFCIMIGSDGLSICDVALP